MRLTLRQGGEFMRQWKRMKTKTIQYRPAEFARLTGVTVRTLHHYDRLGLLKPSGRTAAGFRFYSPPDIGRLQQIVTLKFIGFPLRQIKRLLAGADLATALRLQGRSLEEKRRQLDQAIAAINAAGRILGTRAAPDWEAFVTIIKTIQMQTNQDWITTYYNDDARKLLAERRHLWTPELQKSVHEGWVALIKDVEAAAAADVDPASPEGRALLDRHQKLLEGFTGGHQAIAEGVGKFWNDRANWSEETKQQILEPFARSGIAAASGPEPRLLTEKACAFLARAREARDASAKS